jgi:hypothetical protein
VSKAVFRLIARNGSHTRETELGGSCREKLFSDQTDCGAAFGFLPFVHLSAFPTGVWRQRGTKREFAALAHKAAFHGAFMALPDELTVAEIAANREDPLAQPGFCEVAA